MQIAVYSDGSGTSKGKMAGFGWVIVVEGVIADEGNGHLSQGTNNDAEMEGAIAGLAAALRHIVRNTIAHGVNADDYSVTLFSDSQLALGWANGSYRFKQEEKIERYNVLRELMLRLKARTQWVKGHSGHVHNERCDTLANLGRHGLGPNDKLPNKKKQRKAQTLKIGSKAPGKLALWYRDQMKIVDLVNNTIENYDEAIHGIKASYLTVHD